MKGWKLYHSCKIETEDPSKWMELTSQDNGGEIMCHQRPYSQIGQTFVKYSL